MLHFLSLTTGPIFWDHLTSLFMEHGLELAMWMAAAAFAGWRIYLSGVFRKVLRLAKLPPIPLVPAVAGLALVLAASRSMGALMLFMLIMGVAWVSSITKTKIGYLLVFVLPVLYMTLRATGAWDGSSLVEAAGSLSKSEERVGSLSYRIYNETMLVEKAMIQPVFGWAGYNRSFVTDSAGRYISVPDGMWILTLGKNGIYGLASMTATTILAAFLYFVRCPARDLATPLTAPASSLAAFLAVFMIDNLFNAMFNPLLMVAAGGIASIVIGGVVRQIALESRGGLDVESPADNSSSRLPRVI